MSICRFAPSPTGFLHVGNIRAAIINFLYAKKTGGKFLLRLDDTDIQRTKDEYRQIILKDMSWLGLEYDTLYKQSERLELYENAKRQLIKSGKLYECYESDTDLNMQRKSQIASGIPPIYNRASLNLTNEQKENYQKQGIKPYYRFLLEDKEVSWKDKIKGDITYKGRSFSDPVLIRDNGVPTYTFCSVVDDIDLKITDIIRGEDHITNTAIQIQIFEALGSKAPNFSHLALIKARESKISKREGGFDIKSLREEGFEPLSIINLLAQIGTSGNINIYDNIKKLVTDFSLKRFSKSSTNYDLGELNIINQKLLRVLPFDKVKNKLENSGICGDKNYLENFWNATRPNLNFLYENKEWWKICTKEQYFTPKPEDKEFLKLSKEVLPEDITKEDSWQNWLGAIKEKSDRKGKELFLPLRFALTGKTHGPEMKNLLPLISRKEVLSRLDV
jgi:glutamyl-tRNA synthetase